MNTGSSKVTLRCQSDSEFKNTIFINLKGYHNGTVGFKDRNIMGRFATRAEPLYLNYGRLTCQTTASLTSKVSLVLDSLRLRGF